MLIFLLTIFDFPQRFPNATQNQESRFPLVSDLATWCPSTPFTYQACIVRPVWQRRDCCLEFWWMRGVIRGVKIKKCLPAAAGMLLPMVSCRECLNGPRQYQRRTRNRGKRTLYTLTFVKMPKKLAITKIREGGGRSEGVRGSSYNLRADGGEKMKN